MNRRYLYITWKKFKVIKPWYLSILVLILAGISVYGLRQNNLEMVRLREAVFLADEHSGDIEGALRNLRQHVHSHMNTDLTAGNTAIYPPIQLKYRYERLKTAERERVAAVNEQVYTDAQAECERQFPAGFSGSGRIPCVEAYVEKLGVKEQPIPDALYKFDFISPTWSPDLAGWSLVLTALALSALTLRIIIGFWFKSVL